MELLNKRIDFPVGMRLGGIPGSIVSKRKTTCPEVTQEYRTYSGRGACIRLPPHLLNT